MDVNPGAGFWRDDMQSCHQLCLQYLARLQPHSQRLLQAHQQSWCEGLQAY